MLPEELLALDNVACLPLLAVLGRDEASHHRLQEITRTILDRSQNLDIHFQRNLLFQTEIMAGLRFSKTMIAQVFEEVFKVLDLRMSETYQMILEEGRQEGHQEGRQEGHQQGLQEGLEKFRQKILEVLKKRFGPLPVSLAQELRRLTDLDQADLALSNALDCDSIEAFRQALH